MKTILAACLLSVITSITAGASPKPQAPLSLYYSCHKPIVRVVASLLPKRDRFPSVRLRVTDPRGREAGFRSKGRQIPGARYGNIYELLDRPERSKAVAVETCGAAEGVYDLAVEELENGQYLLSIYGGGVNVITTNLQGLFLVSQSGRTRHYRFHFYISEAHSRIDMLDESGKPLSDVGALNEW